ncbi:MAG: MFS transporter [Haloechinothrix sp.]
MATKVRAPVRASYRSALTLLLLGTLTAHATMALAKPAASYRVLALGGDERAVGMVAAASALLPIFLAIPMGRWCDRGRTPVLLLAGGLVVSASSVLLAHSGSLAGMALVNAALGIGQLALMVATQAVVAGLSGPGQHDRNFGLFTASASLGQLLGPLIGGWLISRVGERQMLTGTTRAFWTAGGIALLIVVFFGLMVVALRNSAALAPSSHGTEAPPGRGCALALLGNPRLGIAILVSFSTMATVDLLTAYLPVLGEHHGLSPAVVGALLAVRAGFSFVSRLLIPVLMNWVGRLWILVVSSVIGAGGVLGLVVISEPLVLAGLMVVLGLVLGLGQPLTMTWVVLEAPQQLRATALALRITGNRVAQSAGPAAAGGLSTLVGIAGPFWLMTTLLAGSAVGVVPFLRRERARVRAQ